MMGFGLALCELSFERVDGLPRVLCLRTYARSLLTVPVEKWPFVQVPPHPVGGLGAVSKSLFQLLAQPQGDHLNKSDQLPEDPDGDDQVRSERENATRCSD